MLKHLDFSTDMIQHGASAKPFYLQVADVLRYKIAYGKMQPGDEIPPISVISAKLGINRNTVLRALGVLAAEGLIRSKKGKGTIVEKSLTGYPIINATTTLATHMAWTTGAETELLLSEKCHDPSVIQVPESQKFDSYQRLKHIHRKDGRVFGCAELYLASFMFDAEPDEFKGKLAVRATIAALGKNHIQSIRQTMTIHKASQSVAECLEIKHGSPIAQFIRVILDSNDKAVYVGSITYPGSAITYVVEMAL